MVRLRATPKKPTASTIEAVDVLNSAKKDAGTRRHSERFVRTPERQSNATEAPTCTSPRKRKEPPTAATGPTKLQRVSTRASGGHSESVGTGTSMFQHTSSTKPGKAGRRSNVYDGPEANEEEQQKTAAAPALKKQKNLNRKAAKDFSQDNLAIGLPASSPAKATRSHDKVNGILTTRSKEPRDDLEGQTKRGPKNILAQASKQIAQAQRNDPEEHPSPPGSRKTRSSNGLQRTLDKQLPVDSVSATRGSRPQPNGHQPASVDEEYQASTTETSNEAGLDLPSPSHEGTANSELEAEAIAGVEEVASLYNCAHSWTKIFMYARKAVQPTSSVKPGNVKDVVKTIKRTKIAYNKIYQNEISKDGLTEAEVEIEQQTEHLKGLHTKIAAADPKEHDLTFVEHIHEQVIPRMSFLMKTALAARFDDQVKDLSMESLEELVELMNVIIGFRELAENAKKKPTELLNGKGELILGLAREAMASLRVIRKRYLNTITNHKNELKRLEDTRRREVEIAREASNSAAVQQKKLQERNETYKRKLSEEREKIAEAVRRSTARRAEEERQWKQDLMSNRSLEADRLRRKFNLPYQPPTAPRMDHEIQEAVIDIDDFDIDDNFEFTRSHPAELRPKVVHHDRPRPRREPTEDIPAPVIEPKWTDQQIEALVWGLRAFRGRDRYQDILHAPEVEGILYGKTDFDLMQQALYIKQSMARAMDTLALPNGSPLEDSWSWLRSV